MQTQLLLALAGAFVLAAIFVLRNALFTVLDKGPYERAAAKGE